MLIIALVDNCSLLFSPKHLQDIATGTGRFASFVLDNFRGLDCTVLDLSPFYLAKAKKLLSRFDSVTYVEVCKSPATS